MTVGFGATEAVANRSGVRPRRLRADAERTADLTNEAAAAGADRVDLECRCEHGEPLQLELRLEGDVALRARG